MWAERVLNGFVRRRDGREEHGASRRQTNVERGVEIKSEYRADKLHAGSSTSTSPRSSASHARGSSSTGASWTRRATPTCSRSSTARCAPRTRARRRGPRRRGRAGTAPLLNKHTIMIRQQRPRPAPSTRTRPSRRARRAPPLSGTGTTLIPRGPRSLVDPRASSLDAAATRKASAGVEYEADATAPNPKRLDPPSKI